jgi:hypothetical protein
MTELLRLKPDPIPPLHPVPESLAEGELKARYEDHYRAFYDALWQGARPLCASRDFIDACLCLRLVVEEKVSALAPTHLRARLAQIGDARRVTSAEEFLWSAHRRHRARDQEPLNFVNNFTGLSVELLDEVKQATA